MFLGEEGDIEFSDIIKYHVLMMLNFETDDADEILNTEMINYLITLDYTANEIRLLDYTLKKSKDNTLLEVKANNLITGLWFSDIYPEQVPDKSEKSIVIDDVQYTITKSGKLKKEKNARKSR